MGQSLFSHQHILPLDLSLLLYMSLTLYPLACLFRSKKIQNKSKKNVADLCGKIETDVEIKALAEKFHGMFKHKPHHISNVASHKIQGCDLQEGEWDTVGSIINWNYFHGKIFMIYVYICMRIHIHTYITVHMCVPISKIMCCNYVKLIKLMVHCFERI